MAQYKYVALNLDGKRTKGTLEASSPQDLIAQLSAQKLHCLQYDDLAKVDYSKTTYRMRLREVVIFCRQLETMLNAGVTISRAFQILCDKATHSKMRLLYRNIYENLQKGMPLSSAMRAEGKSFPILLIMMIESGEVSGTLDQVTKRMATHFNNDLKLSGKLRTAMIYPTILMAVSLGVVLLLFTVVLPRLFSMFEGVDLPPMTRFFIWMSNMLVHYWPWLLGGLVLIVLGFISFGETERGRYLYDRAKLHVPKIGKLMRIVYTARFANSMSSLYSSGIPMLRALEISCEVLGNSFYKRNFGVVTEAVGMGQPLAEAMDGTSLFDSMFISLVFIGEEAGALDHILEQAAEYYEVEAQGALERMVALLEPIMIVIMAIIVCTIVVAVIMPVYTMYGSIT